MEYCCHRPDRIVVGRIGQRLSNSGLENPPTVRAQCTVLWDLGREVESNTDDGGPACEFSEEAKALQGLLHENYVVSGSWD